MDTNKRLRRKVRNSYVVSTVSITLVLFLMGSMGYLMVAAMKIADTLQSSVQLTVELSDDRTEAQQAAIAKHLAPDELVAQTLFVGKQEKAADEAFRTMFGSEFEEVLGENPLLDSFEVTLTAEAADQQYVADFIAATERLGGVDRVTWPAQMAERLHATVGKMRLVLALFGGALLIVSLILVNNTIRLAIYSKRYLINTMKLVGATRWFIMRPFLASSIGQGLLSGTGAALLFAAAVYGLNETVPELTTLAEAAKLALIAGSMLLGGVLIAGAFTYAALGKFIRMTSNKIYLY